MLSSPKLKVIFLIVIYLIHNTNSKLKSKKSKLKNSSNTVSNRGFWKGTRVKEWHIHDPYLSAALISFFKSEKAQSILDFGAGTGEYSKGFMNAGIFVTCYDGNPNTQEMSEGRCGNLDLSKPISLTQHDWILSLEVGEHIPSQFESIFLRNLHRSNKRGLVLSWAIMGQGGHSHVNNRTNEYIVKHFKKLGYYHDLKAQSFLRRESRFAWFKNTIMVFRKTTGN